MFATLVKAWRHPHPQKRQIIRSSLIFPPLIIAMVIVEWWILDDPLACILVSISTQMVPQLGLLTGFAFIAAGALKRVGTEKFCAKCDYQVAPTGEVSSRCPECGSDWRNEFAFITGRAIRRPELSRLGILICCISVIPWAVTLFAHNRFRSLGYEWTSTDSLINYFDSGPVYIKPEAFTAIFTRTLSPAEEHRLAIALLDIRKRKGHLSLSGSPDWLGTYMRSSKPSPEVVRRYYEETFPFELKCDKLVVGQSAEVRLTGRTRNFYGSYCVSLMLDRLYVDGIEIREARHAKLEDYQAGNFAFRFKPSSAGRHRIKITALAVAHLAPANAPPIARSPNGEPVIPKWALLTYPMTFERDFDIAPN